MPDPVPIKQGIAPEFDAEREMIDWVMTQLRDFRSNSGFAPDRIALVIMGDDPTETGNAWSHCNSWGLSRKTRLDICASAAALLMQRAIT